MAATLARAGRVRLETIVGSLAAFCTTVSYVPQVRKTWRTGETGDLSLRMVLLLAAGLGLWIVYGFLKGDWVIVAANTISLSLLCVILFFKMRELRQGRQTGGA
ncbi:MAG: loop repeat protein [Hyphomicrobiales bacterium]|nr:loop repeat protein [Hyphomicrobiales bacterium]